MLARGACELAAFQKHPQPSSAARLAPAGQCKPLIADMTAANTVQEVKEGPLGRGIRRGCR